ncbi:MAG: NAD+ synthase [Gammaproteobacteria bacterium]|nr:NAD+ synthase [Gammaproteobacteria bacterium]
MSDAVKVALAQVDLVVGDVTGNTAKIIACAHRARDEDGADIAVFPELALCGYPPEDLLFHAGLRHKVEAAIERIRNEVVGIAVLIGFPEYDEKKTIYNACAVFRDGKVLARYRKHLLPNYAVFDEKRYFKAGRDASVFRLNGVRIGLNICEDVWGSEPMAAARAAGAECVLVINGSPFEDKSQENRERAVRARIEETGIPVLYVNHIGGQDELVFDGGSFAMDATGEIVYRAPLFEERMDCVVLEGEASGVVPRPGPVAELPARVQRIYAALVLGARDYVLNHDFPGVIIGLSGGIDSALVLAIACDAIGAQKVRAVQMPFRYTSTMSQEDSAKQAATLGIQYDVIPIEPMYEATIRQLQPVLGETEADATEENIQARCRGLLLMAISNKTGRMLLTTGNKSEMAVGYATLYGDMAGGFAPIKDCSKTLVYELAKFRNSLGEAIPERVINREPSAELRPDQRDSDSLPDYEVLDPILSAFIEDDLSVAEITARGFDRDVVIRVLEMVKRNEYKRRQAPPGVRISRRAFGRDWRYPITSGYKFPT